MREKPLIWQSSPRVCACHDGVMCYEAGALYAEIRGIFGNEVSCFFDAIFRNDIGREAARGFEKCARFGVIGEFFWYI